MKSTKIYFIILQLFFDPPETIEEHKQCRRSMVLAPSSEEELLENLKKFEAERKTKCNVSVSIVFEIKIKSNFRLVSRSSPQLNRPCIASVLESSVIVIVIQRIIHVWLTTSRMDGTNWRRITRKLEMADGEKPSLNHRKRRIRN